MRNHLIEEAETVRSNPPIREEWVIVSKAAVKPLPPNSTFGEYANVFLRFCTPAISAKALCKKCDGPV